MILVPMFVPRVISAPAKASGQATAPAVQATPPAPAIQPPNNTPVSPPPVSAVKKSLDKSLIKSLLNNKKPILIGLFVCLIICIGGGFMLYKSSKSEAVRPSGSALVGASPAVPQTPVVTPTQANEKGLSAVAELEALAGALPEEVPAVPEAVAVPKAEVPTLLVAPPAAGSDSESDAEPGSKSNAANQTVVTRMARNIDNGKEIEQSLKKIFTQKEYKTQVEQYNKLSPNAKKEFNNCMVGEVTICLDKLTQDSIDKKVQNLISGIKPYDIENWIKRKKFIQDHYDEICKILNTDLEDVFSEIGSEYMAIKKEILLEVLYKVVSEIEVNELKPDKLNKLIEDSKAIIRSKKFKEGVIEQVNDESTKESWGEFLTRVTKSFIGSAQSSSAENTAKIDKQINISESKLLHAGADAGGDVTPLVDCQELSPRSAS